MRLTNNQLNVVAEEILREVKKSKARGIQMIKRDKGVKMKAKRLQAIKKCVLKDINIMKRDFGVKYGYVNSNDTSIKTCLDQIAGREYEKINPEVVEMMGYRYIHNKIILHSIDAKTIKDIRDKIIGP